MKNFAFISRKTKKTGYKVGRENSFWMLIPIFATYFTNLKILTGKACNLLKLAQELIEIEAWLILTFFT